MTQVQDAAIGYDLRRIAEQQRTIMLCILTNIVCIFVQLALPPSARPMVLLCIIVVGIMGTVFTFMLARQIYNPSLGAILGFLTLVPLVGLFVLLIVTGKATRILRENGIPVGLLGAKYPPS